MKRLNLILTTLLLALVAVLCWVLLRKTETPERTPITDGIHPPVVEADRLSAWAGPLRYVPVAVPEEPVALLQPELADTGAGLLTPELADTGIELLEPEPRMTYLGRYDVVGYDLCPACCGYNGGITKSGAAATVGRTAAVNGLPFGTVLYIDGIGERVVEDRGNLANGVIDVLCNDHGECFAITGVYDVYVVEG